MKLPTLFAVAFLIPVAALAQTPITTMPLLAPAPQQPAVTQPPAVQPPSPQAPAPAAPPQPSWVPQGTAELQVLDKVNAQNALLTVKVGQQAQFGSLSIQVQACDIRPPDQPRDSAAYLTITDSHADAPGFIGWMLANDPSLSMLQHPIYDVRVVGCKA
jgi:hypothetical protein